MFVFYFFFFQKSENKTKEIIIFTLTHSNIFYPLWTRIKRRAWDLWRNISRSAVLTPHQIHIFFRYTVKTVSPKGRPREHRSRWSIREVCDVNNYPQTKTHATFFFFFWSACTTCVRRYNIFEHRRRFDDGVKHILLTRNHCFF